MAQKTKFWPRQVRAMAGLGAANLAVKPCDIIKRNVFAIRRFVLLKAIGQPNIAKAAFGVMVHRFHSFTS
jgi:hypothetical protein